MFIVVNSNNELIGIYTDKKNADTISRYKDDLKVIEVASMKEVIQYTKDK